MDKDAVYLVQEINSELKRKYPDFQGIYFFGSRVNGLFRKDSDVDIALIFKRVIDWRFQKEILTVLYELELKYNVIIDFTVLTEQDIIDPNTFFKVNIKNEGIYYAA
ncbi:MAG: nucleotidyltransferase domain-containing protein [bacterium]